MKICILDAYTANPGDLSWEALAALAPLSVYERTAPAQVPERAADAEIVLTNKTLLTADIMSQLPRLQYIGVLATGYDVVDVVAAAGRGIVVTNIPAYSTASVAQAVFAHLLNITHRVQRHSDKVHAGAWVRSEDFMFTEGSLTELAGKTMGIVGMGNTGQAVARIALAFGMKVLALTSKTDEQLRGLSGVAASFVGAEDSENRLIRSVSKEELFAQSDVLSLHCPLNKNTRAIVNVETLSLMKPTAILVNTGRGSLVDEQALAEALNQGRIAAAALDVLSTEPPKADNPLLFAKHCYITPHIAWATKEARERLIRIATDNVKAFLEGCPQNRVI